MGEQQRPIRETVLTRQAMDIIEKILSPDITAVVKRIQNMRRKLEESGEYLYHILSGTLEANQVLTFDNRYGNFIASLESDIEIALNKSPDYIPLIQNATLDKLPFFHLRIRNPVASTRDYVVLIAIMES